MTWSNFSPLGLQHQKTPWTIIFLLKYECCCHYRSTCMQVAQYKKYSKKVPLKTSTLLSLKRHCLTIFLYAKSEHYEERSSRVEDIYVFPVNTLNQYDEGFIAERSCLSFLSQDGQSYLSVYLNVLTSRTVDLHEVMVLISPCWMFNFMLFILVLGTTALWLQYLQEHCWWCFFCTEKNNQKKNIRVYVHQKGHFHSQQLIHQAFFLSIINKKKSCDLVTKEKNLGKLIIYHFWPLFVTKINFFAVRIPEHGVYSSPPIKMWIAFHSSKTWVHFK